MRRSGGTSRPPPLAVRAPPVWIPHGLWVPPAACPLHATAHTATAHTATAHTASLGVAGPSPADLSSYKTVLGLAVDSIVVGLLARRFSEGTLLQLALVASAMNAGLEASHATFAIYAAVNLPVSSVAGVLSRVTLSTLFSKAVPASDAGSALSVLDVLNSLVGIAAPIYGGVLLGRVGVTMQPAVSLAHYGVLLVLLRATALGAIAKQKGE